MGSLRFGEVYEVLDGLQEFSFGYLSGPVVLAEDLKRSVAVGWQIIAAIRLPIPGRYRQRGREIVGVADAVHGVVSSGARVGGRYVLAEASAVEIEEIALERR